MNKLTYLVKATAILGLLALLLTLNVVTFAPSQAFAATSHASTAQSAHQITSVTVNSMQPNCGTSVWWQEYPGNVQHGISYTYAFVWACAGNNHQEWIIDWRDGSKSSFSCQPSDTVTCNGGNFSQTHTYTVRGQYIAKVYNASYTNIAAWATINVN